MFNVQEIKIATVPSNSTVTHDYSVDNGKKVIIRQFAGNACFNSSVKVEITFGDEVLFVTHGESIWNIDKELTGDGTKKVRISLVNDSDFAETIGGYWMGCAYL